MTHVGIRGTGPRPWCHRTDIEVTRQGGPRRGWQGAPPGTLTPGFRIRFPSLAVLQHRCHPAECSQPSPTDRDTGATASHPLGDQGTSWPMARELGDSGMLGWKRRCLVPKSPGEGGHGTAKGQRPEPEGLCVPISGCCADPRRPHAGRTFKTCPPKINAALRLAPTPRRTGPALQPPPHPARYSREPPSQPRTRKHRARERSRKALAAPTALPRAGPSLPTRPGLWQEQGTARPAPAEARPPALAGDRRDRRL